MSPISQVCRLMLPLRSRLLPRKLLASLIVIGVAGVLTFSGCASSGTGLFSKLRLREADGAKSEDPWTQQAGSEGRAGRTVEKEADPLNLRKVFMSEKALEIERNCGVE